MTTPGCKKTVKAQSFFPHLCDELPKKHAEAVHITLGIQTANVGIVAPAHLNKRWKHDQQLLRELQCLAVLSRHKFSGKVTAKYLPLCAFGHELHVNAFQRA